MELRRAQLAGHHNVFQRPQLCLLGMQVASVILQQHFRQ